MYSNLQYYKSDIFYEFAAVFDGKVSTSEAATGMERPLSNSERTLDWKPFKLKSVVPTELQLGDFWQQQEEGNRH
jgi:hypothetical protein